MSCVSIITVQRGRTCSHCRNVIAIGYPCLSYLKQLGQGTQYMNLCVDCVHGFFNVMCAQLEKIEEKDLIRTMEET